MSQEPPVKTNAEPKPKEFTHGMSYDSHGSKGPGVYCTCGKYKVHHRGKPLLAWAVKHIDKTGHKWRPAT